MNSGPGEFAPEDAAFLAGLSQSLENHFGPVESAEAALRMSASVHSELDFETELAAMRIDEQADPTLAEAADTLDRVAGGMGHLTLDDTALRFLANLDNPLPSHLRWSAKRRQAGLDAARRLLEGKDGSGQGE